MYCFADLRDLRDGFFHSFLCVKLTVWESTEIRRKKCKVQRVSKQQNKNEQNYIKNETLILGQFISMVGKNLVH